MEKIIKDITGWLNRYPILYNNLKFLGVILLAAFAYFIFKKVVLNGLKKIVQRTPTQWDDLFLNEWLLRRIAFSVPLYILYKFAYLVPDAEIFIKNILEASFVLLFLLIIGGIITAVNEIYETTERFRERSIKGYLQVLKIIIYIFGGILILGILTEQDPVALITGLGALTAIIILIFRDTILSFVASIQISSYDLLKKGDWIEMPKYGADGDVVDIALHTIKVQNWDKTITVIPTYKLIEDSFKNWRGMKLTGGRRIKRSVFIDLTSVKFCDEEMLNRFEKYQLLKEYIRSKREEVKNYNISKNVDETELINGRRLTNLGTFRAYLNIYLKQREDVNPNLTFLIRHLEPGAEGLPIEIYVFAATTEWGPYEDIQANIFDHIFAVVPMFDLRVFQKPSGHDLRLMNK